MLMQSEVFKTCNMKNPYKSDVIGMSENIDVKAASGKINLMARRELHWPARIKKWATGLRF
jgi:hypothetical protein